MGHSGGLGGGGGEGDEASSNALQAAASAAFLSTVASGALGGAVLAPAWLPWGDAAAGPPAPRCCSPLQSNDWVSCGLFGCLSYACFFCMHNVAHTLAWLFLGNPGRWPACAMVPFPFAIACDLLGSLWFVVNLLTPVHACDGTPGRMSAAGQSRHCAAWQCRCRCLFWTLMQGCFLQSIAAAQEGGSRGGCRGCGGGAGGRGSGGWVWRRGVPGPARGLRAARQARRGCAGPPAASWVTCHMPKLFADSVMVCYAAGRQPGGAARSIDKACEFVLSWLVTAMLRSTAER